MKQFIEIIDSKTGRAIMIPLDSIVEIEKQKDGSGIIRRDKKDSITVDSYDDLRDYMQKQGLAPTVT